MFESCTYKSLVVLDLNLKIVENKILQLIDLIIGYLKKACDMYTLKLKG